MKLRTFIGPDGEVAIPTLMVELSSIDAKGRAFVRVGDDDVPLAAFLNERGARSVPMVVARLQSYNRDGSVELAPPSSPGGGGAGGSYSDEQVRDVVGALLQQGANVSIAVDDANNTITISCTAPASGDMFRADNLAGLTNLATALSNLGASGIGSSIFTAANAAAVRGTLNLGSAALLPAGLAPGNVPLLDGAGQLPSSVLPAIAITDTFVVNSQAAQVALVAQRGDIAVRTDLNKSFVLATDDATTFGNWRELLTPTDQVLSVAGLTGAVTAAALRAALSLVIGTDVQAYDSDLQAIAALATTAFGRGLLTLADAAAARASFGALGIGSYVKDFNFTAAGSAIIGAEVAMTLALNGAAIGAGALSYEKSTAAAPGTFAATNLPVALEAGARLRVTATGAVFAQLGRTA